MTSTIPTAEASALIRSVGHWHHRFRFAPDLETPGSYDPGDLFARLRLGDLSGKRVLDVGTRDGFFAFECERLGAEVIALDSAPPRHTGFEVAKKILGSKVRYVTANVYDVRPEDFGTFDIVLFLGVLYHLRHPLLALDRLRALCRGQLLLESLVCDHSFFTGFGERRSLQELAPELVGLPVAEFLPHGAFHRDWTNKWAPNVACLKALIEDASFRVERVETWGDRALVDAVVDSDPRLANRRDQDQGAG